MLCHMNSEMQHLPLAITSTHQKRNIRRIPRCSSSCVQLLLTALLAPPIVAGVTYILQHTGALMPLYLWGFILMLSVVMMALYPVCIAPLFNKYSPLPEGTLR